jgi:hypothetical protein
MYKWKAADEEEEKEEKKTSFSNQINQVRCCVSFIGVEQYMGLSLSVCYKPFSA